jgi:hypothetical protein
MLEGCFTLLGAALLLLILFDLMVDPAQVLTVLTQNLHLYRSSQVYAPGALEKSRWVPV